MKLLIIAPEQIPVPPRAGGSVENVIHQITSRLPEGHRVTIVSLRRGYLPRKSVSGPVTNLRVPGGSKKRYLANALRRVKGLAFDLIQIDNRPGFAAAVRNAFPHTPIAVFMHSMTFASPPMTTRRKANADFRHADLIVGNSLSLQRSLMSRFPAHRSKIAYVHLGVDTAQFRPSGKRRRGGYRFLFAGRMIPRKGVPTLLRAFKIARKSVPSIRLSVAGGTGKAAYRAFLRRTARRLNVPVRFKGNLPRKRMPAFYRSGDCFVCPSQEHEAFGLVNVEAMASGLPVIASRNGGIPEIVKDGRNGFLVTRYGKPAAFAARMAELARSPELHRRLSEQARSDAERYFGWQLTAAKLMELYAERLKTASAGRRTK
ncbi:glycosyltransferase family 4 protein [Paenibacillus sp. MWE-103]|uniref:Glycosyltransferase family 4 protein n=1 Tax=Paenibacillus artemisiicola TaxID=1172618 RepID=A0ABS3W3F5_9BACL|nr:glycosyltransferase family 4 protein [Paenibacillus artemisiicola]MBO7742827.1 glycosyltransferase family 4 protein [Paenibacillus artemisiicola]